MLLCSVSISQVSKQRFLISFLLIYTHVINKWVSLYGLKYLITHENVHSFTEFATIKNCNFLLFCGYFMISGSWFSSFLSWCFSDPIVPHRFVVCSWLRNTLQKEIRTCLFFPLQWLRSFAVDCTLVSPWLEHREVRLSPRHRGQGREGWSGEMNRLRPSASMSGLSLSRVG